jgi:hypothetical protein
MAGHDIKTIQEFLGHNDIRRIFPGLLCDFFPLSV